MQSVLYFTILFTDAFMKNFSPFLYLLIKTDWSVHIGY